MWHLCGTVTGLEVQVWNSMSFSLCCHLVLGVLSLWLVSSYLPKDMSWWNYSGVFRWSLDMTWYMISMECGSSRDPFLVVVSYMLSLYFLLFVSEIVFNIYIISYKIIVTMKLNRLQFRVWFLRLYISDITLLDYNWEINLV